MCRFSVLLCLVTIQIISNLVEADPEWSEIIYSSRELPFLEMPDDCYGMEYCFVEGDDYPKVAIDNLLENVTNAFQELVDRQSGRTSDDDDVNCPADEIYEDKPIYYVKDKRGEVRAVVQSENKFMQTFSSKTCKREGRITDETPDLSNTSFMMGGIINKFNISCETMYLDFDFFVLNDELRSHYRMEVVTTAIPVACRCQMSDLNEYYKRK